MAKALMLFKVPFAWLAVFVSCVAALVAGCADSDIEKTVPVAGIVTYQGQPLEGYQVTFMPDGGRRPALGVTDAAGKFTLGTNDAGDGAPPGKSKVAFVWVPPRTGEPGQETINDDPSKLPKPKIKIPTKYSDPEKSGIVQDVPRGGVKDLKFELQ